MPMVGDRCQFGAVIPEWTNLLRRGVDVLPASSSRWVPLGLLALGLLLVPSYLATAQSSPPSYLPAVRPPVSAIPDTGDALNFKQIAHVPIMDDFQWNNEPMGIPRGDNGDITMADH